MMSDMRVCVYACMRVCVYACMRVCVYACMRDPEIMGMVNVYAGSRDHGYGKCVCGIPRSWVW